MSVRIFKSLLLFILGMTIPGILISLYLVKEHYATHSSTCDINSVVSCSKVNRSEYSKMFGVPVAIFGVAWYCTLIYLTLKTKNKSVPMGAELVPWTMCHFVWSLVGTLSAFYLIWAEFMIGAVCPACTVIHFLVFCNFAASWGLNRAISQRLTLNLISKSMFILRNKIGIVVGIHLFIIILFNLGSNPEPATDNFATCLTNRGFKMWGSDSCPTCQSQKKVFGENFAYVNYINCDNNEEKCDANKINGVPVWIQYDADGTELERQEAGLLSIKKLAELSGCQQKEEPKKEEQKKPVLEEEE